MAKLSNHLIDQVCRSTTQAAQEITSPDQPLLVTALQFWKIAYGRQVRDDLFNAFSDAIEAAGLADSSLAEGEHGEAYLRNVRNELDSAISAELAGVEYAVPDEFDVLKDDGDAVYELLTTLAKQEADSYAGEGIERCGSLAKFMSSEGITTNMIEKDMKPMTTYTDAEQPFIDFLSHVRNGVSASKSASWSELAFSRAASDDASARELVQAAGYEGNANDIASLRYALSIEKPLVESSRPMTFVEDPVPEMGVDAASETTPEVSAAESNTQVGPEEPTQLKGTEVGSDAWLLTKLLENSALDTNALAEIVGVSRNTLTNMAKGNARKKLTAETLAYLKKRVESMRDALSDVLDTAFSA